MSPAGLIGFERVESLISGAHRSISAALTAKGGRSREFVTQKTANDT